MPEPTIRRVLNEAEDPGGMYEFVAKDLFMNVSDRPVKHKVRVTGDGEEREIAIEQLEQAAANSEYTLEDDPDHEDGFILTGNEA